MIAEEDICSICYDSLEGDMECAISNCGHKFCIDCVMQCIRSSLNSPRCPLDNRLIDAIERLDRSQSVIIRRSICTIMEDLYHTWFDTNKTNIYNIVHIYIKEITRNMEGLIEFSSKLSLFLKTFDDNPNTTKEEKMKRFRRHMKTDLVSLINATKELSATNVDQWKLLDVPFTMSQYLEFFRSSVTISTNSEVCKSVENRLKLVTNISIEKYQLSSLEDNLIKLSVNLKPSECDIVSKQRYINSSKVIKCAIQLFAHTLKQIRVSLIELLDKVDMKEIFLDSETQCLVCTQHYISMHISLYNCKHFVCENCVEKFGLMTLNCPFLCLSKYKDYDVLVTRN